MKSARGEYEGERGERESIESMWQHRISIEACHIALTLCEMQKLVCIYTNTYILYMYIHMWLCAKYISTYTYIYSYSHTYTCVEAFVCCLPRYVHLFDTCNEGKFVRCCCHSIDNTTFQVLTVPQCTFWHFRCGIIFFLAHFSSIYCIF